MGRTGHGNNENSHVLKAFVQPLRDIKQGDPLSPYRFLLCAEGLSGLMKKASKTRQLHGVLSCTGRVCVSHLLFADDCLFICEASMEECHRLRDILGKYEASLGQVINRQKTSLFFSRNTKPGVKDAIKNMLGARTMNDCEKYLGLLMVGGQSKVSTFKELQE